MSSVELRHARVGYVRAVSSGRARQRQLDELVEVLAPSTCRGLVLTGEAGIGKTHLAAALLDRFATSGRPAKRLGALGSDSMPLDALSRVVSPHEAYSGLTPTVSLKRLLEHDSDTAVFMIDDADRLDGVSVETLVEVAVAGLAQLIVTIRTGAPVPTAIERALTNGALARVEVRPLGPTDTAMVAEGVAGCRLSASATAAVHRLTKGNPLYVRELLLAAIEEGALRLDRDVATLDRLPAASERLTDLLEHRLASLTPHERGVLDRIALVGDVGHDEMMRFAGADTLESLERRGLLRSVLDGRRLRFELAHPLHAEIVRSTESSMRSRRVRSEHAEHIRSYGMRRGGDQLRLAAWSLEGIGAVDASVLWEGARMAAAGSDLALAQRLAQAAFDAEPSVLAAQLLGARQLAAGDFEAMKDLFSRWEALVVTPVERATFEEIYTQAWYWRGFDASMIDRLLDGLDGWPDPTSRSQAQSAAAALLVSSGRIDEAVALASELGDLPPGPTAVLTGMTLGHGWRSQGMPIAAEASVAATLELYRSISVDAYLLSAVALAGLQIQTLADAGRFAEIDEIVATRSQSWHDLGDTSNLALANLAIGYSWLLRGDDVRARELAVAAVAGFERNRHPGMRRWALILHALANAEAGHVDDAERELTQLAAQRDHPAQLFATSLARARAWVAVHQGRVAESVGILVDAATTAISFGNVAGAIDCLHDLTRHGRFSDAAAVLATIDAEAIARLEGEFHAARIAHTQAAAAGDVAGLGRCMRRFDALSMSHLAAACADAAALLSSSNREAQRWLGEGAQRRRLGASRLDSVLATGGLTRREREVIVLAAQGRTSREIANELGISLRTVETHLSNAYPKLQVDGRAGLIALAALGSA